MSKKTNDSLLMKEAPDHIGEHFTLINGVFSAIEATELLLNLFSTKIQFHETRNLSSLERFGVQLEDEKTRVKELRQTKDDLQRFLAEAVNNQIELSIIAKIEVSGL